MRICFVDFAVWDYNVDGPTLGPLGGSHSAMCYLAVDLARAGHDVSVLTGTTKPGRVLGVECLHIDSGTTEYLRERAFDFVVILNGAGYIRVREILPASTRLILWTQHEPIQPAVRKLTLPEFRNGWDHIVCVSDWQRNSYIEEFDIRPERMTVLRNAVAPCFESLFNSRDDLVRAKSNPMTLAYTSTPYRGLKHLLTIFPEFRRTTSPDARLSVYSSMAVYQKHEEMECRFKEIYDGLKCTAGVDYFGSVSQPELAARLATSHILAYPNIFPETSCIAVMEALAAGMRVVTTELGALPETCEGFADLAPIDFTDEPKYVRHYSRVLERPYCIEAEADALYAQVQHMNRNHTWSVRAQQWAEFLTSSTMKGCRDA